MEDIEAHRIWVLIVNRGPGDFTFQGIVIKAMCYRLLRYYISEELLDNIVTSNVNIDTQYVPVTEETMNAPYFRRSIRYDAENLLNCDYE